MTGHSWEEGRSHGEASSLERRKCAVSSWGGRWLEAVGVRAGIRNSGHVDSPERLRSTAPLADPLPFFALQGL
jgi:hypothetical protein